MQKSIGSWKLVNKTIDKFTGVTSLRYIPEFEIENAFHLAQVRVLDGSAKVAENPITILMNPRAGTHGLELPLSRNEIAKQLDPVCIEIHMTLEIGQLIIGAVNEQGIFVSGLVELNSTPSQMLTAILQIESGQQLKSLLFCTGPETSASPILKLHKVSAFAARIEERSQITEISAPVFPNLLDTESGQSIIKGCSQRPQAEDLARLDGTTIILTHMNRKFEPELCNQDVLRNRWSEPGRLADLPDFNDLPPRLSQPGYSGPLSILRLVYREAKLELQPLRCFDTTCNIMHACVVGGKLVLALENFLYVMDSREAEISELSFNKNNQNMITDEWMVYIHTIFPVDDQTCIVSCTSADAVLWVNIPQRKVIRRWRLPDEPYGRNYKLEPDSDLHAHAINNNHQLGHLNCANSDGNGGCVVSVLGQGDIGHLDAAGSYRLLATGYIGCHGVRYSLDRNYIYFVCSPTGQLLRLDSAAASGTYGPAKEKIALESLWLQDAEQITDDVFVFVLADRNEISIIDLVKRTELARFEFSALGKTAKFVHVVSDKKTSKFFL